MGQIPESINWRCAFAGSWHGEWLVFKFDAIQESSKWHLVLSNGSLSVASETHKTLSECQARAFPILKWYLKQTLADTKFYLAQVPDEVT